MNVINNNN